MPKFVFTGKNHVGDIACSPRFAANALTQIVHNDEMKAGPLLALRRRRAIARKYPVKNFNEFKYAHLQASFFAQFASNALLERFPELQCSTRYGPFATERLAAAADEQSAAVVDYDAADTDDRTLGVFARGSQFRKSALERFTIEAAAPCISVDLPQRGI